MDLKALDPYFRDANGTIIGLVSTGILMPSKENPYRMQFGGEVLKDFDEQSGLLASKFFSNDALHVSEMVIFKRPVFAGHSFYSIYRVIKSSPGFVMIYGEIRSQPLGSSSPSPDDDPVCYSGLALCAMVDKQNGKIIKDRMPTVTLPTDWVREEIKEIGENFFNLQKQFAKLL